MIQQGCQELMAELRKEKIESSKPGIIGKAAFLSWQTMAGISAALSITSKAVGSEGWIIAGRPYMHMMFPVIATTIDRYRLPVGPSVGAYRRKWEVVRDLVITMEHLNLRAYECISGVLPTWDALGQCYHFERQYDWEGLLH